MIIPADHISFTDDGHAWVACNLGGSLEAAALDRSCKTCDGDGCYPHHRIEWHDVLCPDCIDGRHTFEIGVEFKWISDEPVDGLPRVTGDYRVSVVPGMVLRFFDWTGTYDPERTPQHISLSRDGQRWTYFPQQGVGKTELVTLPPAAKPGMWCVLVRVAL